MKFFKILFALLFAPKVSLVSHKCEVRMNPGFQVWEMEEVSVISSSSRLYLAK